MLELRHLFLWSSGQSVKKKEIAKLLKTSERRPNKWSKSKTLEDKPRSGWPFFHKMFEKYCWKSCKYMRDISTKQKVKKISTSHYRWKFWAQRYGDKLPKKKIAKPWREKGGAHFMQAWCQKDLPTLYQRRTGRQTHMMWTPLETIWMIVHETTYKDLAPKTLDELRQLLSFAWKKCDFGNALGARSFYTSPLRKCQKTYRKTFWLLIF